MLQSHQNKTKEVVLVAIKEIFTITGDPLNTPIEQWRRV